MATREERITSLAATLKSSGMARSESQARMMAEEMVGVEDSVQKRFDDEHQKAQDFLKTAKNLGAQRVQIKPAQSQQSNVQKSDSTLVQPLKTRSVDEEVHDKRVHLEEVRTDVKIGSGSLKDLMMSQITEDKADLTPLEDQYDQRQAKIAAVQKAQEQAPEQKPESAPELAVAKPAQESITPAPTPEPILSTPLLIPEEPKPQENTVLDSEKLTKMMEEDGPLEEHTREIKEKPKNVKPKDEYEEDKVDLSNMFNFGKK